MDMTRLRISTAALAFILFAALGLALLVGCESPTTVTLDNDNTNTVNTSPTVCGPTTELINEVCVAIECDDGFELTDEGECVESAP